MPEIYLPEKIIFERNVLDKFSPEEAERAILISDSEILKNRGTLDKLLNKSMRMISQVNLIVNTNVYELYRQAAEIFYSGEIDLIVAIGSSAVIDCGMLLSHQSRAKFTAIPCCSACSMTDFEADRYHHYRHSPNTVILDPALTECLPSGMIAYDAMSSFAYAVDTVASNDNIIVRNLAIHGAVEIYRNIIPAYRGNITAIEKLLYAMYFAVAAHRNFAEAGNSYLNRVSSFFSEFGYSKSSVCALVFPNIAEYDENLFRNGLFETAKAVGIAKDDDDPYYANTELIDRMRKLQASVGIPRAVSGFNLTENAYQSRKIHSNIPDTLLDLCYYGSFKFMKL